MANTIDFNVSTNAVNVLNKTADAAENTAKGFTSAKAELRALNQQLLQMDSSSEEFKKASARAAELKDNISDLSAEINANAGNAFEGLSNNVGLFGSRLMNLDLKGAGQALTGMGSAVGKIDFKTLKDEVGGLAKGLLDLGKAVLANPFFLAGAALAAIVVYWDEINDAIKGTTTSINQLNEANAKLESQNKVLEHRIEIEKIINGNSEKAYQLTVDKLEKDIEIAANELEVKRLSGDINGVREAENQLLVLRNQLNGINVQHEVDRAKIVENAYKIAYENWGKEHDAQKSANVYDQERVLKAEERRKLEQQIEDIKNKQNSADKYRIGLIGNETIDNQNRVKQNAEILTIQYQIKKLKQDENALAIASKKIIDESLKKEDPKEATERVKTQFEEIKSLGLQRIEVNEVVVNNIISQEEQLKKVQKENADELAKHEKQVALDTANARLEIAQQGLTALTALGDAYFSTQLANVQKGSKAELDLKKKQFAFNKKMQIGGAIMDTAKAITAAIAANPFPSPTLPVSIALASITGAAQIAKIASTKFDGGGGGAGGVNIPTTGGDGTTAPSPANYDFISQQPNQQPPLQAYVVGSQVSSNLEAQQLIQNQSRLGG
jgi:hypothetical protein